MWWTKVADEEGDGWCLQLPTTPIINHLMTDTSRILNNISSAFFLASGCWADLLIIRIFLTCAYAFILAFYISIDVANIENYIWCMACLYLHGSSAVRLILDEGSVELDESKEQVKIL